MNLLLPIESKMEVFARTYSRDTGVTVSLGSRACTDGKKIWVPPIPDQSDAYLRLTTEMFTYHETGHLRTKDSSAVIKLKGQCFAKGDVLNWVRDVVVEHTMETEYPGMANKWAEFLTKFVQLKTNKEMASNERAKRKLMLTLYIRCREKQLGVDLGLKVPKTIQEIFDAKLAKFVDPILAHSSVQDSITLAEQIHDELKIVEPPKPPKPKKEPKPSGNKSSKPEDTENGDQDGDNKDPSDSSEEESDGDESPASGGEGDDQDDPQPDGDQDNDGSGSGEPDPDDQDPEEQSGEGTGGSLTGEGGPEEPSASEPTPGTGDEEDDPDGDSPDPLSPEAEKALKEVREDMENGEESPTIMEDATEQLNTWVENHHVYREAPGLKDKIVIIPPRANWETEVAMYEEKGRQMTAYAGQRMKNLFVSEKAPHWQQNLRSGKIDTKKLHRLTIGCQDICKRKTVGVYEDSAIYLVCDHSGSMDGKKDIAQPLLTALASDLDKLRLPFGAVGFTTSNNNGAEANEGVRTTPCTLNLMKDFHEPYRRVRHRFVWPTFTDMTAELPAIKFAAYKLAERRESKKVLFIITDGGTSTGSMVLDSAMRDATKEFIQRLLRAGVKVVGIGIYDESMKFYCPDFILVDDLTTFATTFYSKLTKLIL